MATTFGVLLTLVARLEAIRLLPSGIHQEYHVAWCVLVNKIQ